MIDVPSIKSHPILVPVVAVISIALYSVACITGGWFLRTALESRAELSVVLDDARFMKKLEARKKLWTKEYQTKQEKFYNENPNIPDCLAQPLPSYYHDNDYELFTNRK